jgi:hypothetical protein
MTTDKDMEEFEEDEIEWDEVVYDTHHLSALINRNFLQTCPFLINTQSKVKEVKVIRKHKIEKRTGTVARVIATSGSTPFPTMSLEANLFFSLLAISQTEAGKEQIKCEKGLVFSSWRKLFKGVETISKNRINTTD